MHETWWLWYRWTMAHRSEIPSSFSYLLGSGVKGPLGPRLAKPESNGLGGGDRSSRLSPGIVFLAPSSFHPCHHLSYNRWCLYCASQECIPLLPRPLHDFGSAGSFMYRLVSMTFTPIHGWIWLGFLTILCLYFTSTFFATSLGAALYSFSLSVSICFIGSCWLSSWNLAKLLISCLPEAYSLVDKPQALIGNTLADPSQGQYNFLFGIVEKLHWPCILLPEYLR